MKKIWNMFVAVIIWFFTGITQLKNIFKAGRKIKEDKDLEVGNIENKSGIINNADLNMNSIMMESDFQTMLRVLIKVYRNSFLYRKIYYWMQGPGDRIRGFPYSIKNLIFVIEY